MDEDEKKRKYRNLLYQVNGIYSQIDNLSTELNNLTDLLTENFQIDEEIIEQKNINIIQETIADIKQDLKVSIIPSIKYKSY